MLTMLLRLKDPRQGTVAAQVIARFLEGLSNQRLEAHKKAIAAMPGEEFDRIVETLYKSANIQLRLADFVFPKPAKQPLPEDIQEKLKAHQSMDDIARSLADRGLPTWVFGADAPVLDLEPAEAQPVKVTEAAGD
jgi:hypothetical protein